MKNKYTSEALENTAKAVTKKEFIDIFAENPEDILGMDWENDIEDLQAIQDKLGEKHE